MPETLRKAALAVAAVLPAALWAEVPIEYSAEFTAMAGSGEFAPHYQAALTHGKVLTSKGAWVEASIAKPLESEGRWSWGAGGSVVAGGSNAIHYDRYQSVSSFWETHSIRPKAAWIQQLWGEARWRSIFLEAGMKERGSALLNQRLTSGDLIESGNTRPIPQVRIGFAGFQPIPLTHGWIEIQGEVAFGKLLDDGWRKEQYNYWDYHLVTHELYNYKRLYLRTRQDMPFAVTVGMQAAAFFGGTRKEYSHGQELSVVKYPTNLKAYWNVLFPHEDGGEAFYTGNHVGSWDLRARYRLRNGGEISAYFSWPWEDGSGIGKMNGWDGLWGIEWKASQTGPVSGAVVEYLDFTNQSGPMHYAPSDYAGTTISDDHASGADDYYNNNAHSSFCYFGRSLGTPALMAPAYNISGYPGYLATALRGFHIGLEGQIAPGITYRALGGYRKAWGNGKFILPNPVELGSIMLEATWKPQRLNGLSFKGSLEIDRGSMPGNAFGALVSVKYRR